MYVIYALPIHNVLLLPNPLAIHSIACLKRGFGMICPCKLQKHVQIRIHIRTPPSARECRCNPPRFRIRMLYSEVINVAINVI